MWEPDTPSTKPKDPNDPFSPCDALDKKNWNTELTTIKGELNGLLGKQGHNGIFQAVMFITLVVLPFFGDYQQDYHQLKSAKKEQADQEAVSAMNDLTTLVNDSVVDPTTGLTGLTPAEANRALADADKIYGILWKGASKPATKTSPAKPGFWPAPTPGGIDFASGILTQLGTLMGTGYVPKSGTTPSIPPHGQYVPTTGAGGQTPAGLTAYWASMWIQPKHTTPVGPGQPGGTNTPGSAPQPLTSAETAIMSTLNGFSAREQTEIKYYGAQQDKFVTELHDLMAQIIDAIKKSNQQSQGT